MCVYVVIWERECIWKNWKSVMKNPSSEKKIIHNGSYMLFCGVIALSLERRIRKKCTFEIVDDVHHLPLPWANVQNEEKKNIKRV